VIAPMAAQMTSLTMPGPYTPSAPAGSVSTCNQATAANPFWFGVRCARTISL
jgi:hypothetical protein